MVILNARGYGPFSLRHLMHKRAHNTYVQYFKPSQFGYSPSLSHREGAIGIKLGLMDKALSIVGLCPFRSVGPTANVQRIEETYAI